jgi:hypothetical protein
MATALRIISLPTAHLLAQADQECACPAKSREHQPSGQGMTAKEMWAHYTAARGSVERTVLVIYTAHRLKFTGLRRAFRSV